MRKLAIALQKCKSINSRQKHLNDALDNLSFDYPYLYSMMFRELKNKEQEANDPKKITKWLNVSQSNSYIKFHQALMLVNSHNIIAKDNYTNSLRNMLCYTIENGTDIEALIKICSLVESSSNLKSIHKCLFHLIKRVKELYNNTRYVHQETHGGSMWNQPQMQLISFYPTNFITNHGIPYFNLGFNGYNYLETIGTTNLRSSYDVPQSMIDQTIISQYMEGPITKWLRYLKLHKYQWFFNELSYLEIENLNENNIGGFITKVNKNIITQGAQKKICISTAKMRERRQHFNDILMALNMGVTSFRLNTIFHYMQDILHYPIPNENCGVIDHLQQDIIIIMAKCLNQLLEKLSSTELPISQTSLEFTINMYLECSLLIMENETFMEQVEKILFFANTLKYTVSLIYRNSNNAIHFN